MDTTPSLLDWLESRWRQPWAQRAARFGLAALAAAWGLNLWLMQNNTGGVLVLMVAALLLAWALRVRGGATPVVEVAPGNEGAPATVRAATRPAGLMDWLAPLRLPAALIFPVLGQFLFTTRTDDNALPGLAFYAFGLVLVGVVVWSERLISPAPEAEVMPAAPLRLRWTLVAIAGFAGALAYFAFGGGLFTPVNVIAWMVSVLAWLVAAWDGGLPWRGGYERMVAALRSGGVNLRLRWAGLLLLATFAVGAYFRFAEIDTLPPEMTSDHVEKLLDVGDLVIDRQFKVFFDRNTGREPFQFYWTGVIGWLLDTGVSHLSLKIGTALLGFLTLPFVFLLGRELEDDTLGLLAAALVAMSFWHTAISRVGLRFPLAPVFVAPALYFLIRGLRRNTRNDFLLAGLVMGSGLFGYSPFRVMLLLAIALVAWFLFWPAARGRRMQLATHTVAMFVTVLLVFMPLLRYANDKPENFWERSISRLTDSEQPIVASTEAQRMAAEWAARFGGEMPRWALQAQLFWHNQWNALRMFNWRGDNVWVNTVPGEPVLDMITGALLVVGTAFLLARLFLKRDWTAGALLLSVPVLLLPSTLALAFPLENPSVARAGGAIPVIFVIAAYPLWLLIRRVRTLALGPNAVALTGLTLAAFLGGGFVLNRALYFESYPQGYLGAAQNASEVGQVIHDYARTFGHYDTAWVRPYPHWVDTRAVGMYAGNPRRDYALQWEELEATAAEPRAKLFILHRDDVEATRPDGLPPTLPELRRLYPSGQLTVYHSARPNRDFLIYFVPPQP
jgi:hypothetical protein